MYNLIATFFVHFFSYIKNFNYNIRLKIEGVLHRHPISYTGLGIAGANALLFYSLYPKLYESTTMQCTANNLINATSENCGVPKEEAVAVYLAASIILIVIVVKAVRHFLNKNDEAIDFKFRIHLWLAEIRAFGSNLELTKSDRITFFIYVGASDSFLQNSKVVAKY